MQNMGFKIPRNDAKYAWTHHVVRKMQYYGLTPSRVVRVIRAPQRVEQGVAENTLAAMQKAGTPKKPWEVWVMWRDATMSGSKSKPKTAQLTVAPQKLIITAWRYPGVSPVRERVPLPPDIAAELASEGLLEYN